MIVHVSPEAMIRKLGVDKDAVRKVNQFVSRVNRIAWYSKMPQRTPERMFWVRLR